MELKCPKCGKEITINEPNPATDPVILVKCDNTEVDKDGQYICGQTFAIKIKDDEVPETES